MGVIVPIDTKLPSRCLQQNDFGDILDHLKDTEDNSNSNGEVEKWFKAKRLFDNHLSTILTYLPHILESRFCTTHCVLDNIYDTVEQHFNSLKLVKMQFVGQTDISQITLKIGQLNSKKIT